MLRGYQLFLYGVRTNFQQKEIRQILTEMTMFKLYVWEDLNVLQK